MFIFNIGEDETEFRVHADAVSEHSRKLDALMKEADADAEDSVDLEDVDEETFTRFCELCYRHDYALPVKKEESPRAQDSSTEDDCAEGSRKKKRRRTANNVWNGRAKRARDLIGAVALPRYKNYQLVKKGWGFAGLLRRLLEQGGDKIPIQDDNQVVDEPDLLAHAKLYVFVEVYRAYHFKDIILLKLVEVLVSLALSENNVASVVEFTKYAYSEENAATRGDNPNGLRTVALQYVLYQLEQITEHRAFTDLLREGGDFVAEFWAAVWQKSEENGALAKVCNDKN